ncbi:hypothetical protein [Streptomyces sp. SID4917]|uniref:hypothetical protein n=1 Tax=Streptomyces sp. SID4917 TaxID=2690269 RepID=UPI00081D59A7|nr:hypothetical protein [Streptomyces sp. SID4917]SCG07840.1 hypothetical protein GA0115259_111993 [Streptomyces sp. MnatMP-M17]
MVGLERWVQVAPARLMRRVIRVMAAQVMSVSAVGTAAPVPVVVRAPFPGQLSGPKIRSGSACELRSVQR